jgi:hypothetical protein
MTPHCGVGHGPQTASRPTAGSRRSCSRRVDPTTTVVTSEGTHTNLKIGDFTIVTATGFRPRYWQIPAACGRR